MRLSVVVMIQMKATEYFPMVLFVMMFKSLDENLCDDGVMMMVW